MSVGGSKGGSSSSTSPDAQTREWVKKIYDASQQAAGGLPPGVDPLTTQAGQFYGGQMTGAQTGQAALGGDAAATAALSDPYTKQVIDANRADWANINQGTANQVNSQATLAGAFGGSRAAVTQGAALGANNRAQAAQEAQLRSAGYGDAMNRAQTLIGNGFMGAQGAAGIGDYQRRVAIEANPAMWRMNVLKQGLAGTPYGMKSKGRQYSLSAEGSALPSLI